MQAEQILEGSIKSASYNIVYQIGSRILTFLLNAFTLRYISPDVLGVINVRLTLLYSTTLFISREAFRRACLSKTSDQPWAQVINLVWLVVPNSILCSLIFGYAWIHLFVQPDDSVTTHYAYGVVAIGLSCVIEMLAAPANIIAQAFFFVKLQVLVNTVYVMVRALTLCFAVVWMPEAAVLAYGIGHVVAALIYTSSYYGYFWYFISERKRLLQSAKKTDDNCRQFEDEMKAFPFHSLSDFMPRRIPSKTLVNHDMAALTCSFFTQGLLKQLLTEGERYLMTFFNLLSFSEQGIYDVVANLSSLVVRFVFLPIEDSSYYYFAQMIRRDKPLKDHDEKEVGQVSGILKALLRFMVLTGLIFVVFGYNYSHLLLRLYGGTTWSEGEGPTLLRAQCLCVLFLALNGVTEAYVFACMSQHQINQHNIVMVFLSVIFLVVSWILAVVFGSLGFVLANCCNMLLRIILGIHFIHEHFDSTPFSPWRGLIPGKTVGCLLVVAAIVNHFSEMVLYNKSAFLHVIIGGSTFTLVLAAIYFSEKEIVSSVIQKFVQRKKKD